MNAGVGMVAIDLGKFIAQPVALHGRQTRHVNPAQAQQQGPFDRDVGFLFLTGYDRVWVAAS